MPCEMRLRRQFEVVQREVQKSTGGGGSDRRPELEDLYVKAKKNLEDHIKALERLRKRLREATSEIEKERIRKEIADMESEIEKYQDLLEKMEDFMRDLERRTIKAPSEEHDG